MPDRAAAAQPVHRHRCMAQFAGGAVGAVEDATFGDDRPADASRDGQVDEVGAVSGGAERHLPQSRDVRVALQEGGQAQCRAEFGGDGNIVEILAHIRRLHNEPAPRIDRTGAGDADADNRLTDPLRSAIPGDGQGFGAGTENRRGAGGHGRGALGARDPRSVIDDNGRANLRAAYVERENRPC